MHSLNPIGARNRTGRIHPGSAGTPRRGVRVRSNTDVSVQGACRANPGFAGALGPALLGSLRQYVLWLGLLCLLNGAATRCAAQSRTQREYELKAGVLYHIIEYVEWPESAQSNQPPVIQIGLLGQIPFAEALEVLDGKMLQGRKLVVKRLARSEDAAKCQVLFIGASEKPRVADILSEVKHQPILTVGEVEGFAERGGMVNLITGPNRIVMEINREVAGQAGLGMSSHLLKLAKLVPR